MATIAQVPESSLLAAVRETTRPLTFDRRAGLDGELQLAAIADTIAEGILILDAAGIVRFANAAAERMLKRPRRSLIGRDRRAARIRPHHLDGRPIKDEEGVVGRLAGMRSPIVGEEWRLLRPDRTFLDVTVNAAAVRDASGTPVATVLAMSDITERRRVECALREAEDHLRAIVDATFDGIVALDGEGRIVEFNPAAETIFGRSRGEVIGQPAQLLLPQRLRGAFAAAFQHQQTAPTKDLARRLEMIGMRGDGTEFPVEVSMRKLKPRGRSMYVAAIRELGGA